MYLITPYNSIGNLKLLSSSSEIEQILGQCDLESNILEPDYLTGLYQAGIVVSYRNDVCCFIGINSFLKPVHIDFDFSEKSYDEVLAYFFEFPDNIFAEDGVSLFSELLGIGVYFEDGIKEVSICSKDYSDYIKKGMKKIRWFYISSQGITWKLTTPLRA